MKILLVDDDSSLAALPQVFRCFYRGPQPGGQSVNGTGIGLYIVKEIVTLHGGYVEVTSTAGKGSTFTIYLSLYTPANLAEDGLLCISEDTG